jgi:hypothetical protein
VGVEEVAEAVDIGIGTEVAVAAVDIKTGLGMGDETATL